MEKENIMGVGGLIAAAVGSVCCVGPVILAGLGFGAGALSFVREFGVIHMPMMIIAVLLLGLALYFFLRRKGKPDSSGASCENITVKTGRTKVLLLATSLFTVFLILLPYVI